MRSFVLCLSLFCASAFNSAIFFVSSAVLSAASCCAFCIAKSSRAIACPSFMLLLNMPNLSANSSAFSATHPMPFAILSIITFTILPMPEKTPITSFNFSIAAALPLNLLPRLVKRVMSTDITAKNGVALAAFSPIVKFLTGFITLVTPCPKKPILPAASAVCIA